MPSLAFDKQGKPFTFHRQARQLGVRVFSNPGGRGSCFPVHDDDGNELFVDVDADFQEFREAVKNVPGQYRLDQYDEHGAPIEGAPAAYVTIRDARNASSATDTRDVVLLQMAQSNAELARTNSETTRAAIGEMAAIMRATAEILHAPVKPPPPIIVAKTDGDQEEGDDDQEEGDDESAPDDPWAAWRPFLKMAEPHLPAIGAALYKQLLAYLKQTATPPPAAAPRRPMPERATRSPRRR